MPMPVWIPYLERQGSPAYLERESQKPKPKVYLEGQAPCPHGAVRCSRKLRVIPLWTGQTILELRDFTQLLPNLSILVCLLNKKLPAINGFILLMAYL